jgi:hypothetical protein
MGSSFGKILSYIVSIFVLFIIIPYLFLSQLESTKETYIYSMTTDFADKCMSTGQITPEKLEMYSQKVYGMGHYEIKMEHDSKMAFSRDSGEVEFDYLSTGTEQILNSMYLDANDSVPYKMKTGDRIYVTVTKTGQSTSEKIMDFIGVNVTKQLIVNYGGTVGTTTN